MQTQTNSQNNVNNAAGEKFFDIHTTGIGYLNRVRQVQVKKGPGYWACDIAALSGKSDNVNYVFLNLNVVGAEAGQAIRLFEQESNNKESKVLVKFKMGDLTPETFVYEKDGKFAKKGDLGVRLFGRLLAIDWIKVNGEMRWHSARDTARTDDQQENQVQPVSPEANQQPVQAPVMAVEAQDQPEFQPEPQAVLMQQPVAQEYVPVQVTEYPPMPVAS